MTHLELTASLIRWKRHLTLRFPVPSDPTSHLKALQFTFTPLGPQVLEWWNLVSFQCLGGGVLSTILSLLHVFFHVHDILFGTRCLSGLPKAAVVNQNRLLTALAVLTSNGVSASDIIYLNLPLYHTAGFIIGFIGSIETGEPQPRRL